MKRFLKDSGVVRPSNKAFAFRQLDEALEWVEARVLEDAAAAQGETSVIDLRDMPLFAGHADEALNALETTLEIRAVKAGKKVFKAGTAGEELFLIRRGMVKVSLSIHKKESYHLATCGAGDLVGEIGFLDASVRTADALALTDTEVYVLPHARFLELTEQHRALALAIAESIARNLGDRLSAAVLEIQSLRA
jgi:SulP family sulfate permease